MREVPVFHVAKNVGQLNLEHFKEDPLKHIGLVGNIAGYYTERGFEFDDIVLYGIVGLLKACKRFDKEFGVKFCTYANHWINEEIKRAFRCELLLIRVPEYMYGRVNKVDREKNKSNGKSQEENEYMEAARKIWRASFFGITPGIAEQGTSWSESSVPDYYEQDLLQAYEEDCEVLRKELTKLEAQEHKILIMLYFQEMPIIKISKITGLERDVIRKLRNRALQKLRVRMGAVGA